MSGGSQAVTSGSHALKLGAGLASSYGDSVGEVLLAGGSLRIDAVNHEHSGNKQEGHNYKEHKIVINATYVESSAKDDLATAAIPHDMRNILDDTDKPDSTDGEANFVDDGNGKVKSGKSHEFLGVVCDEACAGAVWASLSVLERAAYILANHGLRCSKTSRSASS